MVHIYDSFINSFIRLLQCCHCITSNCLLSAFQVPCLFPLDFSEARVVFLVGQNHVKKVKYHFMFRLFSCSINCNKREITPDFILLFIYFQSTLAVHFRASSLKAPG